MAITHIQNTEPKPPRQSAVDTPTIFPVPTVAEMAVQAAPKELISSLLFLVLKALNIKEQDKGNLPN